MRVLRHGRATRALEVDAAGTAVALDRAVGGSRHAVVLSGGHGCSLSETVGVIERGHSKR